MSPRNSKVFGPLDRGVGVTRLLQAIAGAEQGGAEGFFERLALGLQRAGQDQRLLIRSNPKRAAMLRAGGAEVVELPFGGVLDWRTGRAFRRQVADFRPRVVLTWMNRATSFCPRKGGFVHVARLGGYYDLKYYRHCHHLIGNTPDIVEYLIRNGWPPSRAHYLPNFATEAVAAPVDRALFDTPADVPLIVALGRLHENKAFDVLLAALAKVPEAHLWLAGDGPLRTKLEKLAEWLEIVPRVRFLGWRDDVPALLAAADLFVCPSRHEPLGNVVIEAWTQGVPVIAAASQGPSMLIDDDQTGLLVPVDEPDALAAAIFRMLHEPGLAERLGPAGRDAYEKDYTEAQAVAAYMAFFDKVAG